MNQSRKQKRDQDDLGKISSKDFSSHIQLTFVLKDKLGGSLTVP